MRPGGGGAMSGPGDLVARRYRLVRRLGGGGMGVVWEARDERLDRTVAVKELQPQRDLTPDEAELANRRAMREARITAQLEHPYAVSVFDVVDHQGQICLIMQFVPSQPLSRLIRGVAVLSPEQTARIGFQVGSALAAAHEIGIVHRDVKPGNVLVAADGTARISDFGISHALGDRSLAVPGMVHGTPAFLAPEIARGGEYGYASDVYGLGATLYAAVEGAPPFGTDQNPVALLQKVATGRFVPPVHSARLTPLLLRMLVDDPAERPSMAAVAQRLGELGDHDVKPLRTLVPAGSTASTPSPEPPPAEVLGDDTTVSAAPRLAAWAPSPTPVPRRRARRGDEPGDGPQGPRPLPGARGGGRCSSPGCWPSSSCWGSSRRPCCPGPTPDATGPPAHRRRGRPPVSTRAPTSPSPSRWPRPPGWHRHPASTSASS